MNSDYGTNADSLDVSIAEQDRQQCAALRRAINGERIRTLCAIGDELSKLFKQVTTPAWSGPMTESVDRVERRLAECPHCAGTGFVALGGSYEAADQRCEECKGRGRK